MSSPMSRRRFLTSTATAAGAVALGCRDRGFTAPSLAPAVSAALPDPASSGIEHVIVFMMENRSFDHFLGWLPGADGRQDGLTYVDTAGVSRSTFPLSPDFQGCSYRDPDHSYEGGRVEYDGGACDGGSVSTTSSPSATTVRKTCTSSVARLPSGLPSIGTTARFSDRPSPIASTSTPDRPTGS